MTDCNKCFCFCLHSQGGEDITDNVSGQWGVSWWGMYQQPVRWSIRFEILWFTLTSWSYILRLDSWYCKFGWLMFGGFTIMRVKCQKIQNICNTYWGLLVVRSLDHRPLSSRFLSELRRSPSQLMSPQRGCPHTLWTTQVNLHPTTPYLMIPGPY